jgi:hypothetical protein
MLKSVKFSRVNINCKKIVSILEKVKASYKYMTSSLADLNLRRSSARTWFELKKGRLKKGDFIIV